MRLNEFVKSNAIPREALLDLLLTNKLPLEVDEDGYLCLALNNKSLDELVSQTLTATVESVDSRKTVITARMDRIIREELGSLIEEALVAVGAGGDTEDQVSNGED